VPNVTDGQTDRQICYINIARQYANARQKALTDSQHVPTTRDQKLKEITIKENKLMSVIGLIQKYSQKSVKAVDGLGTSSLSMVERTCEKV